MKIEEIMTKKVISVRQDTSIVDVAKRLNEHKIHSLPVEENGKLVGIITESDLFATSTESIYLPQYIDFLKEGRYNNMPEQKKNEVKKILSATARDIMTPNPITLKPENDVSELLKILKEKSLHSVPIIDEQNSIIGIVTVADVIKILSNL